MTKVPAARHGLKIINVRQSDIFPCFSSKSQNIYTKIFYLYLQSSSASRQPKNFERDVSCKPCIQSTKPSKRLTLRNFSMTRLDTFPKELHISLWNIPIFPWKIFYLHLPSSSASRKWKNSNVVCFADPRLKVLREFSPNITGHGLRVTKRPAVWHFSIFLFEKYQILLEIFYLYLESSSTSIKWKNSNVVLFADSVHRVRRDPSLTLQKNFPSDSSGQNSKYSKETEKWRTENVFTVKQLTICSGWLLRKTISEGFQ